MFSTERLQLVKNVENMFFTSITIKLVKMLIDYSTHLFDKSFDIGLYGLERKQLDF
jgi:hypothetical protein